MQAALARGVAYAPRRALPSDGRGGDHLALSFATLDAGGDRRGHRAARRRRARGRGSAAGERPRRPVAGPRRHERGGRTWLTADARAEWTSRWTIVSRAGGLANLANALWMLPIRPAGTRRLPAAVPDTGPFNTHFVRDIGSAFGAMGAALLLAAVRPALRVPMLGARLRCSTSCTRSCTSPTRSPAGLPASHWSIDAPGVYVPALLLLG